MDRDRHTGISDRPDFAATIASGRPSEALWEWEQAGGGGVFFLDFRPMRDSIGENWDRLEKRIHSRIQQTIGDSLTGEDQFARFDDFSFLVGFDQLSGANAEFRCAQICRRISRTLLGQDAPPEMARILTFVLAESGEVGINESKVEKTDGIDLVFLPLMSADSSAVSTFLCMPIKNTGGGFDSGYSILAGDEDGDRKGELDLLTLRQATHTLDDLARSASR